MNTNLEIFERKFREQAPAFFGEYLRTKAAHPEILSWLARPMLDWAHATLGGEFAERLIKGYCFFVVEVNRAQIEYERQRRYKFQSFAEVFEKVYSNQEFMDLYHWGVYCSTFIWQHHLHIYQLFENCFLPLLKRDTATGTLLDLGAGSGIWHLLAMRHLPEWRVTAVDISETSIQLSALMASTLPTARNIEHVCADATRWATAEAMDAGISSFLLEHLERPELLLASLATALRPGAHAFVTCALTAAEIDHIYEFRRESEVIALVEEAGFRVKRILSSEPEVTPPDRHYLPRSMAMILQKRRNDIW